MPTNRPYTNRPTTPAQLIDGQRYRIYTRRSNQRYDRVTVADFIGLTGPTFGNRLMFSGRPKFGTLWLGPANIMRVELVSPTHPIQFEKVSDFASEKEFKS